MDELRIFLKEEVIESATRTLKNGQFQTKVKMDFTWINADNPEEREVVKFEGLGVDATERSMGIAESYAEKMMFLKNLQIPLGELDPDNKQAEKSPMGSPEQAPTADETPGLAWIDTLCCGLKTKKDWDNAWNIFVKSQQFKSLSGKDAEIATAHFNDLSFNWRKENEIYE